jgi:hypothetical protein
MDRSLVERQDPLRARFNHIGRLRALLTFSDFELHRVAFLQALVAFGCYGAVVNENIRPIRASDEAIAFGIIEPLDGPFQTIHVRPRFPRVL